MAGYTETGGAFNNPLSSLRSLGIVDYTDGRKVIAKDLMFID